MRRRVVLVSLAVLAVLLWGGLFLFMNYRSPTAANQALFLLIWGAAIFCSVVPVAYVLDVRWLSPWGRVGPVEHALRQGFLVALLAMLLMALRFMRLLTVVIGLPLALVVILVEALVLLKNR